MSEDGEAKSGSENQQKASAAGKDGAATAPNVADITRFMVDVVSSVTQNALQIAAKSRQMSGALASVLSLDAGKRKDFEPEYLQAMADAGAYLKDARRVAGLTLEELGEATNLKDRSLLSAVESGTATLSFDLILRLASLLARHDPVPFVLKLARAYTPQAWQMLDSWGAGRIPLQLAREREFINIYRRHDVARDLSDEEFARVLAFTDKAFELALAYRRDAL